MRATDEHGFFPEVLPLAMSQVWSDHMVSPELITEIKDLYVACKIIDGGAVTPEERHFIGTPLLMEDRWWRCDDGQLFDIQEYSKAKLIAGTVETLRDKCNDALTS